MAKAVLLVPRDEMIEQAERVVSQYRLDFLYMKVVTSAEAAREAELAVAAGAELIIARGLSALQIKKTVHVPVVEITLTGQELGQLVMDVRQRMNLDYPKIGMIGFRNMFSDMTAFNALYQIDLHTYFVEEAEQLEAASRLAAAEHMDVLIGGDTVMRVALELGIPSYFLSSGAESIAEAFRVAEQVSHAIDREKRNTVLFKTLLDYSFNGIVQIGRNGEIEHVNHLVEKLLNMDEPVISGRPVRDLFPEIDEQSLDQVLQSGEEIYSTVLVLNRTPVIANLAPLRVDHEIQGAILSYQEGRRITEMEAEIRKGQIRVGNTARWTFERMVAESESAKALVASARRYSSATAPVLIIGEDALEREMLAQCIHNAGVDSNGPFISFSCDSLTGDSLCDALFGAEKAGAAAYSAQSLVSLAEGGTLFLDQVSRLDLTAQYRLLRVLGGRLTVRSGDSRPRQTKIRVITADSGELAERLRCGEFRKDLFYRLETLPLSVPSLQHRHQDVRQWIERSIEDLVQQYERFVHLTSGAMKILEEYPWEGHLSQIFAFCERLVTQAPRRSVDEITVRRLLQTSVELFGQAEPKLVIKSQSQDLAENIRSLMRQYRGNRREVAQELGVSTTTLWRYMKRFGIEYRVTESQDRQTR